MVIEIFIVIGCTIMLDLNYGINIYERIGMVATKPHPLYDAARRAPVLKFLENTIASLKE